MLRKRKVGVLAGAATIGMFGASVGQASIIYLTSFNSPTYSDGGLIGQDGWLITGTSVVNPISVSNTATNGFVSLVTTGQDVNRPFTPAQTSGSIYLGADISLTAAQATGDYFIHMGDGGTSNFAARVFAKSSGAGYVLGIQPDSAAGGLVYGSTVYTFGTIEHIVAVYDIIAGASNDTAELYVNPTDPIQANNTPIASATNPSGADQATISSVNLRQGTTANAPTETVDNIVVATDFASAAAVPEPASGIFVSLLAIGLLRRRSHSKA